MYLSSSDKTQPCEDPDIKDHVFSSILKKKKENCSLLLLLQIRSPAGDSAPALTS